MLIAGIRVLVYDRKEKQGNIQRVQRHHKKPSKIYERRRMMGQSCVYFLNMVRSIQLLMEKPDADSACLSDIFPSLDQGLMM